MMKRILFVDPDASQLDALRARLRRFEQHWHTTFVTSGEQALECLQQAAYDVIVSELGLPGMDGVALLRAVSGGWPQTVRLVRSGDQPYTSLVSVAHQFVSKNGSVLQLENVIERCLDLQDLVPDLTLRAAVGRAQRLPPLRSTQARLQSVLTGQVMTISDVAEIVASDVIVAAKVLHVANASFSRPGLPFTSIEKAVTHLGIERTRDVLSFPGIFGQWPRQATTPELCLERLQQGAQSAARAALAVTARTSIADATVLTALVRDIGYWVLALEHPRELESIIQLAQDRGLRMYQAEREVLGISHAEIGAYLLGIWGFPRLLVETVAHHHSRQSSFQLASDVSAALAVASALSRSDADVFDPIAQAQVAVS